MRSSIFFFILGFLLFYLTWKINFLLGRRLWVSFPLALAIAGLAWGWLFTYRGNDEILNTAWYPPFMWVGSTLLGFAGCFLIFSLVIDALHLFLRVWDFVSPTSVPLQDSERRSFFLRSVSLGALLGSTLVAGAGFYSARRGHQIKKVNIPIQDLSEKLENLKIVQISDLHIGLTIDKDYVQNVVTQVMKLKPDLIAITGDLVDGTPTMLEERWQPLRELQARHGVFFITGNHEYYSGVEAWLETLRGIGFENLVNENKVIFENGVPILIAGVPDIAGGQFIESHRPDIAKAAKSNQETDLKILLGHRPEFCFDAESAGFDLLLCGHTHAGQFFPFNMFVMFAHKYYKGLNRHGRMWVYVNQGTGYWGPANRFALPPEITEIRFVKS